MTSQVTQSAAREPAGRPGGAEHTRSVPVFAPATDIYETKAGLVLVAEIPGADPDSIEVTFDRNVLRLTARSKMAAPAGHSLIHAEYRDGDYERSFVLPVEIDAERIEATVKDGLLRLVLPRSEPAPAKKIAVKAG
ncbi:MAG: Hsp20 family protein [Candidatus Hydrogenedens sp.]|nr:Hsp20 family protein [Candidatus Hydrogenedens sp.]